MALTPNFAGSPVTTVSTGNTANALRTGAGAINTAFTAGANGSRISRITISATGTTTAGAVRFFVTTGAGTPAYRFGETIGANTASATNEPVVITRTEDLNPDRLPINLMSGQVLSWTTEKAETFNVTVEGANY